MGPMTIYFAFLAPHKLPLIAHHSQDSTPPLDLNPMYTPWIKNFALNQYDRSILNLHGLFTLK